MSADHRTPPYGYPDDPPCEECGAAGGIRCFNDCPTGGEPFTTQSDVKSSGPGLSDAASDVASPLGRENADARDQHH